MLTSKVTPRVPLLIVCSIMLLSYVKVSYFVDDTQIEWILNNRHSQLTRDYQLQNTTEALLKLMKYFLFYMRSSLLTFFFLSVCCVRFSGANWKTFPLLEYLLRIWTERVCFVVVSDPPRRIPFYWKTCVVASFTMECEFFQCAHHTRHEISVLFFSVRFHLQKKKNSERKCFFELKFSCHFIHQLNFQCEFKTAGSSGMEIEITRDERRKILWEKFSYVASEFEFGERVNIKMIENRIQKLAKHFCCSLLTHWHACARLIQKEKENGLKAKRRQSFTRRRITKNETRRECHVEEVIDYLINRLALAVGRWTIKKYLLEDLFAVDHKEDSRSDFFYFEFKLMISTLINSGLSSVG